jgi:5,10-methylene-tetrahydrofolate dehydrogenase/methenyl tetrahydrofolate cyclohydrolase
MKIIDGKTLAQNLRKNIANEVKQYSRPPGLAVVLVGMMRPLRSMSETKQEPALRLAFIQIKFTNQQT